MKKILNLINFVNEKIVTHFACWLVFPLIFVVVYEVCARYLFNNPTNWAFDLSWMFCGAFVFLGGGYTLLHKGHVKVDLFYDRFPKRVQALINIVCYNLSKNVQFHVKTRNYRELPYSLNFYQKE